MEELWLGLGSFFSRDMLRISADMLDILVVATLIYFGLSLIRGTRGMQMSIGLALVFLIYQVAKQFDLATMWTLLDQLLDYSVLVIVIIFQSDIRRALMRVGLRPFLRGKKRRRETHEIEEVIKATRALAQRRIGALIVFQRDASLDDFIEKGTELDAVVSKELLYSIFIPSYENPMHDGAAIIRDGRVAQAGSFLPLSIRAKVDQKLGARHRAAIGISEETDAVVVIVSEERGTVSLCFGGNVVQGLDGASLREALHGLFYQEEPTEEGASEVVEAIVSPEPPAKTEPPTRTSIPVSSSGIVESPGEVTIEDPDSAIATVEEDVVEIPTEVAVEPEESEPEETAPAVPEPVAADTEAVVDGIQVKATKRATVQDSEPPSDEPEKGEGTTEAAEATDTEPAAGEAASASNVTPISSKWEGKAG